MQFNQIIEIAKVALECLLAILGWIFLRRLEQIKSEVARRSDFNQKWADLLFDASNAFMISVERLLACLVLTTSRKDPNDPEGVKLQEQINALLFVFLENRYRIQRLAILAPSKGPRAEEAANDLYASIQQFFATKVANVEEIRRMIDSFNTAVRAAHAEMIASRKNP